MLACWCGERVRNQNSYRTNPMKKLFLAFALVACFAVSALSQGAPPWTIQEVDGSPRVNSPTLIKVTNGTLSCTGKTCTITISGGGGGSPGGSSTQVQYNAAGSFGGISGFTSDGTNVTAGSANLRATRPRFITSIDDTNGNEVFIITATGSAVNEVTIANAATGNNPTFTASGSDANVGINFVPKGSGTIQVSGVAIVTVSATQTLTNKTISGASNTLSNIGNSSLTNSSITINAGTNFGLTVPGASSLGATVTLGSTSDNLRFGNLGLGVAAPTSGGQIATTLGANNITGLLIKRNTDTSPTGNYFDFQNAAGTTVAKLDVAGALTVTSCTGCGGGGSGITVGTTTITSGTNTRVLYNNSGVVGEYAVTGTAGSVVLSASPTLTGTVAMAAATASGTIVQTSASATAFESGPNGSTNPVFRLVNNVASAASGVSITGRADGTAPTVQTISRTQQTASVAGNGLEVRADDAVAGSSTAGAAAGGVLTLQSGAAARLTSGNANGGNINLVTGTGIGTGTAGQVVVPDGVAGAPGLTFSSSSGANGYGLRQVGGNQIYVSGGGVDVFGVISTGRVGVASTALFTFSSTTNAGGTAGITLRRAADANLAFGAADAASPVAQTLSVQNVVGGTTNTAGVNWTFAASRGTGTGAGGDIIFQTAPAGGSGTTQNTLATAFTIQDDGAVQLKSVTFANLPTVANGYLIYCSDCTIASPCASGGSGALAKGINGAWVCN